MTINTVLIADLLAKIQSQIPGCKATVMLRTPGAPENDLLLGDDTLDGIHEILDRSAKRKVVNILGRKVLVTNLGISWRLPSGETSMSETQLFEENTFAVVDVMGHQTFAGKVSQHVLGGTAFIRVDVPEIPEKITQAYGHETIFPAIPSFTKLIGAGSIYAITPCTEELAVKMAAAKRQVPVEVLDVRPRQERLAIEAPADDDEADDLEFEDMEEETV